jgi:hypothetical protein
MIVNYASSVINKLKALLTDDARVIIYNSHVFIVQATGGQSSNIHLNAIHLFNTPGLLDVCGNLRQLFSCIEV